MEATGGREQQCHPYDTAGAQTPEKVLPGHPKKRPQEWGSPIEQAQHSLQHFWLFGLAHLSDLSHWLRTSGRTKRASIRPRHTGQPLPASHWRAVRAAIFPTGREAIAEGNESVTFPFCLLQGTAVAMLHCTLCTVHSGSTQR